MKHNHRVFTTPFHLSRLAAVLSLACAAGAAHAGATFKISDEASFSIGAGLRASYNSVEDAAPSGTDSSNDFEVDNVRIYMNGKVTKEIGATFNTERNSGDGIRVLDAYVQFEPMPEFNIWLGRMLPASDRANLDGPFYLNVWDFPLVSQYPNLAVGRDNGVQVWGKLLGNKLTYAAGAFKGHNNFAGASNQSDKLLYAGRVAYALLDPEPAPAYYNASTYYGAADILTVAASFMSQKDGVGVAAAKDDYFGWNADVLFEKKFANVGVVTLEGAYYNYDLGGTPDCGTGEPGSPACPAAAGANDNVGGLVDGSGYLATAAYLIPTKVAYGQFQPFVRYQKFDRDLSNTQITKLDIGVNYVIKGHDARITAFWAKTKDDQPVPKTDVDKFVIGAQVQF